MSSQNNLSNESFDLDELQNQLEAQLEENFSDLEGLEEDFKKIGSPEALGDTIQNVIWEQFINQIGLENGMEAKKINDDADYPQDIIDKARNDSGDFIDKAVINRYVKKTEKKEISYRGKDGEEEKIRNDIRFTSYKANIDQQRKDEGGISDGYTGKIITEGQHNVDHVMPGKKIYEDKARKFAGIESKDLANLEENFVVTNENLNKSKKEKTNVEYVEKSEIRKKTLTENYEKTKENILSSNHSEEHKKSLLEIEERKYRNKIDARDDLMLESHKKATDKIDSEIKDKIKDSVQGKILIVKEQGKVIASSSFKVALMGLLAELVKEIIQKLIQWLYAGKKNLSSFFDSLKKAITNFISNLKDKLFTAADTFLTSIVTAIFGPIIGTIKKVWIFLKQGYKSLKQAIDYIKNPENRNKPMSILMLEVGKIVIAGLTAGGAIVLGQVIEKGLMTIPIFAFPIPLLGSLGSILGIFFGAISSGIIGAIAMNLIDKLIAEKQKRHNIGQQLEKKNEILTIQNQQIVVSQEQLNQTKDNFMNNTVERHTVLRDEMNNLKKVFEEKPQKPKIDNSGDLDDLFDKLNN